MDGTERGLTAEMADAGCSDEQIAVAENLLACGMDEELRRHLKRCRSALLLDMHESQRRVDRMDDLIRQTEKTLKNTEGTKTK